MGCGAGGIGALGWIGYGMAVVGVGVLVAAGPATAIFGLSLAGGHLVNMWAK